MNKATVNKLRRELRNAREDSIVEPDNEANIDTLREALRLARMSLHRIDLIIGDATDGTFELEGKVSADWL